MAQLLKPIQFGRFELTDRIAIGGMAEVFIAKLRGAMGFEKNLAVKRILPDFASDRAFVTMLATEAKLVCNLEHPNIVQVYELGEVDGRYYIAMEYVNGVNARVIWQSLAKRGLRLPQPLALHIVAEVLKGLDHAHQLTASDGAPLGVVHRDVSPSNILISYHGDVKIGDFGIAVAQHESKGHAGGVRGKLGYMTPEQLSGLGADARSDIFSAGIVLAEFLTGVRLFRGQSDFETMQRVLDVRTELLEMEENGLPPEVVQIARRALQRDPAARYRSAEEFHEAIATFLFRIGLRVSSKTIAAFLAEHVVPFLPPGRGGQVETSESDEVPEPESITTTIELTPSYEDEISTDTDPTIPDTLDNLIELPGVRAGQNVDWTRLAPEDEYLDGTPVGAPGRDGGGLAGHRLSEIGVTEPPQQDHAAARDDAAGRDARHFGETEFDFADESQSVLLTEREALEASLAGPPRRPPESPRPEMASLLASNEIESADVQQGRPDFSSPLNACTVAKVLFRLHCAEETGLLVVTGPGGEGRQAELQEWIAQLQTRHGTAVDRPRPKRRTCLVHFQDGQPDLIAADCSEEMLAAHLVRVGALERQQVTDALRSHPNLKPVAALLAAEQLVALQVSRQVASFVQWSIFDSFGWSEGQFSHYRGRSWSSGVFPASYGAMEMIARGVSHLTEQALDRYLARLAGRQIGFNRRPPRQIELLEPDELTLRIYRSLTTQRPLKRALEASTVLADPRRVKQAFFLLIECELATVV